MTSATLSLPPAATVETAPAKRGFFARLSAAIVEARMRQVEREVLRYKHLLPPHQFKVD